MGKDKRKSAAGRPTKGDTAKRHQIAFRVDDRTFAAVGQLTERMGVVSFSASDTAREVLLRALKKDGLL